jgi:hypothetical protein
MKLITEVTVPGYPSRIDHRADILLLGSCFTENIGSMLKRYRFPVTVNPFGTIFNPASVAKCLEALMKKPSYTTDDLREHNGQWFSFDHYTGFSSENRDTCLNRINEHFDPAKSVLASAEWLIITWGTSWVFTENNTGGVVSNCHKIPATEFTRTRLSVPEIVLTYKVLIRQLFSYNPELRIVLTVSPVRHWKDGAHGNQLSKAALLLATEELQDLFPEKVYYFPSYEIVMDELRDYRFYADDMLHTNTMATSYIWKKFRDAMISEESKKIIEDLEPWLKLEEHRPKDTEGEAYRRLLVQREEKRKELRQKYPFIAV